MIPGVSMYFQAGLVHFDLVSSYLTYKEAASHRPRPTCSRSHILLIVIHNRTIKPTAYFNNYITNYSLW